MKSLLTIFKEEISQRDIYEAPGGSNWEIISVKQIENYWEVTLKCIYIFSHCVTNPGLGKLVTNYRISKESNFQYVKRV